MDIRDFPCEKERFSISWHKHPVDIRDLPCEDIIRKLGTEKQIRDFPCEDIIRKLGTEK